LRQLQGHNNKAGQNQSVAKPAQLIGLSAALSNLRIHIKRHAFPVHLAIANIHTARTAPAVILITIRYVEPGTKETTKNLPSFWSSVASFQLS